MSMDPAVEQQLRKGFKYLLNPFMVFMWRLGLGQWINIWPDKAGRILVLTHTGRKSGRLRRTPVNYALVDGELYCCAGFGNISDWYRNLMAHPRVEIWLPNSWWAGMAEDITGCADHLAILRQVLIASGFAAPLVGIDPQKISDEELAALTADYRLLHLRRLHPLTGPGGPGDLALLWPLATIALLIFIFARPRRQRR
jgi:deazaflavin-dependent oxidoreductase (nitroreductase family)